MKEREALWHRVFKIKYGEEEGGWRSCEVESAHGVVLNENDII